MRNRRGFTFLELLTTMVVLGILASMAVLKYINLKHRAIAAQISGEIGAIRLGAYNYWADHESFPPDASDGIIPPELAPYLPGSLSFAPPGAGYTLDWDNLGTGGGGAYEVGITVNATDPKLQATLLQVFSSTLPFYRNGNQLTYILVGPSGQM